MALTGSCENINKQRRNIICTLYRYNVYTAKRAVIFYYGIHDIRHIRVSMSLAATHIRQSRLLLRLG
jgi:hypothetical protein